MKTQTLIIFMILSLSNATFLGGPNPATGIANPNFIIPKIEQMIASLSNFRKSIASRPQKSFLRFDAGDEDDIAPLTNALGSITGYVGNLNKDYDGFFDINDLLKAEKIMSDHSDTFRNVNNDKSTDMLATLAEALSKMEFVRTDVKTMIWDIKNSIDGVNKNFSEALEPIEKMSTEILPNKDEIVPMVFIDFVKQLDKALLSSIDKIDKLVEKQITARDSLISLDGKFDGMVYQLKAARDANSPYMENTLQEWLLKNGTCVIPCVGVAWGMIFGAIECASCLFNNHLELEAQKKKIEDDLEAVTKTFNDLISSVQTYANLGKQLEITTEEQIEGLGVFKVDITIMENKLKGFVGYGFADKIPSMRVKIVELMAPLAKNCEELQVKFLKS